MRAEGAPLLLLFKSFEVRSRDRHLLSCFMVVIHSKSITFFSLPKPDPTQQNEAKKVRESQQRSRVLGFSRTPFALLLQSYNSGSRRAYSLRGDELADFSGASAQLPRSRTCVTLL